MRIYELGFEVLSSWRKIYKSLETLGNLQATFAHSQATKDVAAGVSLQLITYITGCRVEDITKLDKGVHSMIAAATQYYGNGHQD